MRRNVSNSSSCCHHLENSQNEPNLLDIIIFIVSAIKATEHIFKGLAFFEKVSDLHTHIKMILEGYCTN